MPDYLDVIAAKLADVFYRETEQRKVKWGHLSASDRSLWRLIARVAEREFSQEFRD